MASRLRRGFCKDCCANVSHARRFRTKLGWLLDVLTFQFSARFRLGSWRCLQCSRHSIYLHLSRSDAKTIQFGDNSKQEASEDGLTVEHGGNFLLNEKSLLARRERCNRYSEKYRESIVHKILVGDTTIADVRQELGLSEQDVLDWIAQAYDDRGQKIKELEEIIFVLTNGSTMRIDSEDQLPDRVVAGSKTSSQQN